MAEMDGHIQVNPGVSWPQILHLSNVEPIITIITKRIEDWEWNILEFLVPIPGGVDELSLASQVQVVEGF